MERLTVMTDKGAALVMGGPYESEQAVRDDLMARYKVAVASLAAYEDTGLEPDEIELLKEDQEIGDNMTPQRLAEILQAERDGRLVVIPRKEDLPAPGVIVDYGLVGDPGEPGLRGSCFVAVKEVSEPWVRAILTERERQDKKWGFPQENTYCEWASILAEEVGELAKELNELNFGRGDIERMEAEAVQVAAVALDILEQSGVALRVTEQVAKALRRVPARPKCFYGDTDLCRGMSVNNDDEPIEVCKRCRWCSAGYQRLEAEAAVEKEDKS